MALVKIISDCKGKGIFPTVSAKLNKRLKHKAHLTTDLLNMAGTSLPTCLIWQARLITHLPNMAGANNHSPA